MKNVRLVIVVFFFFLFSSYSFAQRYWIATTASNWNNTANWSVSSGGAGGASVPSAGDLAIFNGNGGRNGNCTLDTAPAVAGITLNGYTGTLDLSGFTLTTTGNNVFSTGTISNSGGSASITLNTTGSTIFSGTTFNANIIGTSGRLLFNASVFNNPINLTKTDSNNDNSSGGNVFNGSTTLTNNSSGQLLLGNTNADQFNAVTTFNNNGSYRFYFAHGHTGQTTNFATDVILNSNISGGADGWSYLISDGNNTAVSFGGTLTINCAGSLQSNHRIANGSGSTATYSGNVIINATNTHTSTSIAMGVNGTSTYNGNIVVNSTNGNNISFATGSGSASTLAATKTISIGGSGFVDGALTLGRFIQSGSVAQTLTTLSGTATLTVGPGTQFGGSANFKAPRIYLNGATFNGAATIEKSGASDDYSTGGNLFNSTATLTNSSTNYFILGNTQADQFSGTTIFNNTGTGNARIYFAHNHGGQTTTFASDVTLNSNKTGGTDGWSYLIAEGNNVAVSFGGNLLINCAGALQSNHRILQGSSTSATYSGNVVINSTNANASTTIYMGANGLSTYNGNIAVSNSGGSNGIAFNTGASSSSSLAATKTITIGGGGFNAGTLNLARFTQTGSTNQTLTAFSGTASLAVGPSSSFGGNVNFAAPQIYLNGCTYNGTAAIEKTGASDNNGDGGNTFTKAVILKNSGSGYLLSANNSPDNFNSVSGNLTITNSGTNVVYMAHNTTGTQFNGDIILNATSGNGIYFSSSSNGSSTLAAGKTILLGGSGFASGDLRIRRLTQSGTAPINLNLPSGTVLRVGPSSTFGGNVDLQASDVYLDGVTVGGTANIVKNGPTSNTGLGNNIFNGVTTITNNGGDMWTNGSNTFNASTNLINTGTGQLLLELNTGSTYNGDVTFITTGTGYIRTAYNGNTLFNGNLIFNSTNGSGIYFGQNSASTSTLASGKTLSIGTTGFSSGNLSLVRFSQAGSTSQALTAFTGTAALRVGPQSSFVGNVDFRAPQIYLDGCNYGGTVNIEKTGASDNSGAGGNTFAGVTTLTNSGSGYLLTGGTNPDVFSSLTTFNNTGSSRIHFAQSHTGLTTTFAGNVILNSNKTGSGDPWSILFCEGTDTHVRFDGTLTINCNGSERSDHRFMNGFNSDAVYNGNVIVNVTNTNSATNLSLGENGLSTYKENISVSNSGGANGIIFNSNTTASSTLAALKTISIGAGGFNSGYLHLRRFTQIGSTAQTLTTFSGTALLAIGPASQFDGNVNFIAPRLFLNGCLYNGTAYLEKNGVTGDTGLGNNTFATTTTIVNNGTGVLRTNGSNTFNGNTLITNNSNSDILLEANSGSTYNGDVTFTNAGSSNIRSGFQGTNLFNGNIIVNNVNGSGIIFCESSTATATLGTGKTITVGSSGFTTGALTLYRFTQVGITAQNLTLTNVAQLVLGPSSQFDGATNFIAPRLYLNGTRYGGVTYMEKNGAGDDNGNGGNEFNGVTTLANSGSGYLLTANTSADVFNTTLTLNNTGSNYIYLSHNAVGNQFNGSILVNNTGSAQGIRFSNGTGTSTLSAGNTISVGNLGFNTGELLLKRFTQVGATTQNITLTSSARLISGPASQFDGNVTFIAPRLSLNGCTYNGTAYLEKNASVDDNGAGGNVFNGATTIVNSGNNYLLSGASSADIFNANLIITNSGSSTVRLADNTAGNQFNQNVELNSASGGGIYFGNSTNGTSTLATGKTISVGSSGFITGDVRLIRFTQVGPTAQTLNLGGIAILTLGPTSSFGGNVDFRSPQIYMNGTTFNGTAVLEKKGASDNYSNGGNTFVGSATLIHSGSGYLAMAQSLPDFFQSDLTATNTGSNAIHLANNVVGNIFNGNITFNSTLGSQGIYIGNNSTGAATLGTGASLLVGGLGFSSGELRLKRLTQTGSSSQTLLLTGTALLRVGPSTVLNGVIDFRAPRIALDGAVYGNATYIEKTGAGNDNSAGNNFFNGTTTLANSGSGQFINGVTALDTFNGDLTLTNTGTSSVRVADNISGTVFKGNIFVNSINNTGGSGIFFSANTGGSSSLDPNKTIAVGSTGFSAGELSLARFTQNGGTSQTLTFTGTAILRLGPTSSFSGNVDFRSPQLYMEGATYQGTAFLEKTGASDNNGNGNSTFASTTTIRNSGTGFLRTNGGNTFNGTTSLINSGSNYFLLEFTTGSVYNGDLTLTNSGTSNIRMAYQGSSSFNGNISVNSTNGTGIYFGELGTATATLANSKTISVGVTGFTTGTLWLQRFTQNSSTAQNVLLTGNGSFKSGPASSWNGAVTVSSPQLLLDGNIFNGTTNSFTKTGTTNDNSNGGNTFASGTTSTFTNTASGAFRLANVTGDTFLGGVVFIQSAGTLSPVYNGVSTFAGDITTNGAVAITFGNGATASSTFTGTANQSFNKAAGTASPVFTRFTMNKASGTVSLNTDISITGTGTFTSGVMNATATNYPHFANAATATINALGNNSSYVEGPVRKTGTNLFSFPTGNAGIFRPISISAPSASTVFTAQYFKTTPPYGGVSTYDPSFVTLSGCEYWILDRTSGAGTANVTLSWVASDCIAPYITNPSTLRVARWNSTSWVNQGNGGVTGSASSGTVTTSAAVASFSPFTIASTTLSNPLPIELVDFTASLNDNNISLNWITESELNNDFFSIERSTDGMEFSVLGSVKGAGTTSQRKEYAFIDSDLSSTLFYYRLRQTDFDKKSTYSKVIRVSLTEATELIAYPNPTPKGIVRINSKGDFALYNNLGQMVTKVIDSNKMDVSQLPSGIYTLRSSNGMHFRLVIE